MGKCRTLKINKARFRWKSRWLRPEIFLKYMQDDETNCHKSRIILTLKKNISWFDDFHCKTPQRGFGLFLSFNSRTRPSLFTKIQFFLKILTFPNYLSLRKSTDIKSAQKFQLKPGKNRIENCVETHVYLIILGF